MRPLSPRLLAAILLCSAALPMQASSSSAATTNVGTADAATPSSAPAAQVASATASQTNTVSDARVTFAPTDGARFLRRLSTQSSITYNGEPRGLYEISSQVLERWEKSGDQWLLHCAPQDVSVEASNAAASSAKLDEILLSQPYIVVLNKEGTLVEVRGFDDLPAKLKEAFGDTSSIATNDNISAQHRQIVALSPSYHFNWLYGKRWKTGEHYERDMTVTLNLPQGDYWKQINTITAIDPSIVIVSFENNAIANAERVPSIHTSEKGTATLDTASGQLRQLQKTHFSELTPNDAEGNRVSIKRTDVLSITWTRISE